ncbi:MAG: dihydroorotase [Alphaproteobacteria bacterium]|jgi:dihydroorotase|nr:dihydroorotase [Alphaproteobacteria bacterium]MBT4082267.1 dihydroorotase [Alphaproteobacteria bacterium]MBT4542832.1 dihydroorotase [Alphaproteobacteria bacterium]MBT7744188.1 dihydroorotase [Alphaproteobacteria bacterium]
MSGLTAFINARLMDPASKLDAKGGLIIKNGKIREIIKGLDVPQVPYGAEIIDCEGHVLAPGLIDARAYLGEPGQEQKETMATASQAAAAGGITTIAAMASTDPCVDEVALVEFVSRRARDTAIVNVVPTACVTRGRKGEEITEMGMLAEAGAVAFSDGHRAIGSAQVMRRALAYATGWDLLIIQHPEEPSMAASGAMNAGEMSTRLGIPGVPSIAEVMMVERDLRLVEMTGGRYHAACISTEASIKAIRQAKDRGLPVTCSAAAHHFALNELAVGEYRTFTKVSPPLRSEADRLAVVAGLEDGTIDCIVSDHSPHDQEAKRLPFAQAADGSIGLQTVLPLALELHHTKQVPLMRLLDALTRAPAQMLGLPSGKLAEGAPADLILIDLDMPWRITESLFLSRSKNSAFEDRPTQGRAIRTIVAGETVFNLNEG